MKTQLNQKMKEALVSTGPRVEIIDSPIPAPQAGQVLIRVIACASNPKDWKSTYFLPPQNQGEDIAGYVESVGEGVSEFHPGDRVAALHEMFTPHGAYAEYSLAWAHVTFHLPENISFENAATIPLSGLTAALGLYRDLKLPSPWITDGDRLETSPLVIYGAGTSVGAFAIQLARKSGIHPIICVAGQSKDHVRTLIDYDKGDTVIDYRSGPETVIGEIQKILGGKLLLHAFDAVGEHGSDKILGALLHPQNARLTTTVPKERVKISDTHGVPFLSQFVFPPMEGVPEGVESFWTALGSVFGEYKEFAYIFSRYLSLGLKDGWLKPHPCEMIPGGLNGLVDGLTKLQEGKAHASKYVYRIRETDGLGAPTTQ